ncbi:MAG TPA: endonuclease III [Longilinea sp.]|nr:endonuclease III [Longilinea sp.]
MQSDIDPILHKRALEIYHRLLAVYGVPQWRIPMPALDELVSTILSQNTNDRNRDAAFERLRSCFPTWEQVRDAPIEAVVDAIRTAGLANQKGPRIQQVLKQITAERGTLDLSFLERLSREEVFAWLVRFKGVGPKTASIVLQFSLGQAAFPVDTHIYRVSGRLGLRPDKMTVEQAHTHLAELFPADGYGPAHLNLIRLGRETCHARRPDCPHCPVLDLCDYGQKINLVVDQGEEKNE